MGKDNAGRKRVREWDFLRVRCRKIRHAKSRRAREMLFARDMHLFRQYFRAHLRYRGVAYLVLLISLVPTFLVYWRVGENAKARDRARFSAVTTNTMAVVCCSVERDRKS